MDTAVAAQMHDLLLGAQPETARHDVDTCPFCVEKASQSTTSGSLPAVPGPDVSDQSKSTEGGTPSTMSDISQEAHEALQTKAVLDATKATEEALAIKTKEADDKAAEVKTLNDEVAKQTAEVERLNKALDEAQVKLTAATEEAKALKDAAAKAEEDAKRSEAASKRTDEVKTLGLFPDEYIAEQASKWAELDDLAWGDRVEEWKKLKPAGDTPSDTASAMTGTSGQLATETKSTDQADADKKPGAARRAALGLK